MEGFLKEFLSSGKRLLEDTKKARATPTKKGKASRSEVDGVQETDPHKIFIKRCISEKPKKAEVVKDIKRFIEGAEAEL